MSPGTTQGRRLHVDRARRTAAPRRGSRWRPGAQSDRCRCRSTMPAPFSGPTAGARAHQQPGDHRAGDQRERGEARRARDHPGQHLRGHASPPDVVSVPSRATRAAGTPHRSARPAAPARPATSSAVASASASAAVAATAVARSRSVAAGRPRGGVDRVVHRLPPRRQRRRSTPEVARPAARQRQREACRRRAATRDVPGAAVRRAGRSPRCRRRRSPGTGPPRPCSAQARSAASPFAIAPRSRTAPGPSAIHPPRRRARRRRRPGARRRRAAGRRATSSHVRS